MLAKLPQSLVAYLTRAHEALRWTIIDPAGLLNTRDRLRRRAVFTISGRVALRSVLSLIFPSLFFWQSAVDQRRAIVYGRRMLQVAPTVYGCLPPHVTVCTPISVTWIFDSDAQ